MKEIEFRSKYGSKKSEYKCITLLIMLAVLGYNTFFKDLRCCNLILIASKHNLELCIFRKTFINGYKGIFFLAF